MSHIVGTVQVLSPALTIGPDSGLPSSSPNTWTVNFAHVPAPTGTKFLILHFQNVSLPASNRLEVTLGWDSAVDVFTSADGPDFWTRPINIYALVGGLVPISYITSGSTKGSVQLDKYGRGESHAGDPGHPSISNCDPFQKDPTYLEPTYDPFWYCMAPPNWENIARVTAGGDIRARVARSVGMVVTVEGSVVSTCSVTLVDADKVVTAGHCHSPTDVLSASVIFNYETDASGNRPAGYSPRFFKVKEALQNRYDGFKGGYDYSLLQLKEAPPGIPVVQMRHDVPAVDEQVFGVHHPNGAVKKLSIPHPGFDLVIASDGMSISVPGNWAVSGGSSGSGIFDTAGRIAGVLSNGDPCHSSVSLYYATTAAMLKAIAPAPPPPVTRDVVLVFDRSGSMSLDDGTGRKKIDVARDAASLFVQLARSGGNRLGLVSFSTAASSPADFGIAPVTAANKTKLVGPAPYSGGKVGALAPGGATSIGDGLDHARQQFPGPGANPRAILLMTDGLENTPPMINTVQASLLGIDVHAIGFGTESSLNGALLTSLAATHNGQYVRAGNGLALEKFFSHAFGNIFEAGTLMDPEFDLPADQRSGKPLDFLVCGEELITVVVGWDHPDATLIAEVTTPGGATILGGSPGVQGASGRTWTFLRIPLPHGAERDGTWSANVFRPGGGEFPPPGISLRYFIHVIATGGPRLDRVPDDRRYYTGDSINPLVLLRYPDGTWPANPSVDVTVSVPTAGPGNILTKEKLRTAIVVDQDTLSPRQSTLIALEREAGHPLFSYTDSVFGLSDDSMSTEGKMEPTALLGKPLADLLTMEGNYTFHTRARYGENCTALREAVWALHVDVGIDAGKTGVTTTVGPIGPGGRREVTITVTPRDKYGNNLGPGRQDGFTASGAPGVVITGPRVDNGDGSYTVPGTWDPGSRQPPGVIIGQPGRPPVVLQPPSTAPATGKGDEEENECEKREEEREDERRGEHERRVGFTGKIGGLAYDEFGDFEGFVLETEDGDRVFGNREHKVEELVHRAWRRRLVVTVYVEADDRHRPMTIILRPPRSEN